MERDMDMDKETCIHEVTYNYLYRDEKLFRELSVDHVHTVVEKLINNMRKYGMSYYAIHRALTEEREDEDVSG
jgi:DNA-binding transcriptional regulator YhcF (GntR family)